MAFGVCKKKTLIRLTISGKGNLQVLAQCGSYVPADEAQFGVKKNIFSLMGDYISANGKYSSFEREMVEINYILQNFTNGDSLILVDELARNTNYYEGLSIIMTICMHILDRLCAPDGPTNVTVVFTTHHKELTYLQFFYSIVKCVYFETLYDDTKKKLNHTFQLKKGVDNMEHYGI